MFTPQEWRACTEELAVERNNPRVMDRYLKIEGIFMEMLRNADNPDLVARSEYDFLRAHMKLEGGRAELTKLWFQSYLHHEHALRSCKLFENSIVL